MKLNELTGHELKDKILAKEVSAVEALNAVLGAIRERDGQIHAYLFVNDKEAVRQAENIDKKIARNEPVGALAGIPIAVKDNFCTQGIKTTCGSRIIGEYVPPYNATVVNKIHNEDAVVIGKTNLDEFAMGSSTENSAFGASRNPWDIDRTPGGSSGGSAAAVASDEAVMGLGSDTGGSIRQPASFCGVVGLKPTYGRVSRYGLIAFASSLDQIGPITKDITDSALLLEVISGHDPHDATSAARQVPRYTQDLSGDIKGMKVGVPSEYFIEGIDAAVKDAIQGALKEFEGLGVKIIELSLPHTEYCVATYYIVATAEASSNLARYDGVQYGCRTKGKTDLRGMYCKTRGEGFGPEVKRRILLGTYALSSGYYDAYYLKAQKVRTLIKRDFESVFRSVDVIITPTSPTTAFKIGDKISDPLEMYLSDIFTISANLAGIPGISLPCGIDGKGLPIGMQILGKPFDEASVLRAAYAYEQATEWHKLKPKSIIS